MPRRQQKTASTKVTPAKKASPKPKPKVTKPKGTKSTKGPNVIQLRAECKEKGIKLGSGYQSKNELLKKLGRENEIKHKKKKDPNAPKRPLTAYMLYSQEVRPGLKEKNPGKSVTDIAKLIGVQWNNLPQTQKNKFVTRAAVNKEKYDKEFAVYKTEKDKHAAPKRPRTSYIYFSLYQRPLILKDDPKIDVTEVAKIIGKIWKTLTDTQKQQYKDMAAKDKTRYEKEKAEWEKREGIVPAAKKQTVKKTVASASTVKKAAVAKTTAKKTTTTAKPRQSRQRVVKATA